MRTVSLAIMAALVSAQLIFPACRKQEATMTTERAREHVQEKLKQSFAESKRAVAAMVNGEAITEFSVIREMNAVRPQYLKAGQKPSPELDAKIRHDALDVLITQELAVQEARKRGMKARQEVIEDALGRIRTQAGPGSAYVTFLAEEGLTEDELRKIIERDVLFEMVAAREVDARIEVTEAALKARYAREKTGLTASAHGQVTFAEARPLLEQKARAEAGEKRMQEWEKELRKNASIEIAGAR